jgi:hypothetical protein
MKTLETDTGGNLPGNNRSSTRSVNTPESVSVRPARRRVHFLHCDHRTENKQKQVDKGKLA